MNDCPFPLKSGDDVEACGGHHLLQKSSGDGEAIERYHVLRNDGDDVSFGHRHLQWFGGYDEMFGPHRLQQFGGDDEKFGHHHLEWCKTVLQAIGDVFLRVAS